MKVNVVVTTNKVIELDLDQYVKEFGEELPQDMEDVDMMTHASKSYYEDFVSAKLLSVIKK